MKKEKEVNFVISQIELLNKFDRSFTDEELFQLLRYFRSAVKIESLNDSRSQTCSVLGLFFQVVPSEKIRKRLPYVAIFQLCEYVLFRQVRIQTGQDIQSILDEIPRLKEIVARFQKESPVAFPKKVEESAPKPVSPVSRPLVASAAKAQDWKKKRKEKLKAIAAATPRFPVGLTVSHQRAQDVPVTVHAWDRFVKRYSRLAGISTPGWYVPEHFAKKIKEIFARSVEVQLSNKGVVKRLINNDFIPVRYFLDFALQLRFVVKEESPVLLTVEIATRK